MKQTLTSGEKRNGPNMGPCRFNVRGCLRQVVGDRREFAAEIAAGQLDRADDHDADEGGEKAVFDSRGARLVSQEPREDTLHRFAPCSVRPASGTRLESAAGNEPETKGHTL